MKDCIPIEPTTEWLPLNLTFRQISMGKLVNLLRQRDLEKSFERQNILNEDAVRAKRVESDFEKIGFYTDYFWWILATVILIKHALHALGE